MTELKRAVCYYRESSIKIEQNFISIEIQQIIVRNFCKNKGYQIYKEFEEIVPDTLENKKELTKALNLAKEINGTFIVTTLDRFVYDAEYLIPIIVSELKIVVMDSPPSVEPCYDRIVIYAYASVIKNKKKFIDEEVEKANNIFLERFNDQKNLIQSIVEEYNMYKNNVIKKILDAEIKDKNGNLPSQDTIMGWINFFTLEKYEPEIEPEIEHVPEPVQEEKKNTITINNEDNDEDKVIINGKEYTIGEVKKMIIKHNLKPIN